MKNIFILILIIMLCIILTALPLYFCVYFVCWVFNIPYHLSLLQAFALSLFANIVHRILVGKGGNE